MPLTKASYSMITGAPVNVMDFGASNDGTNAAATTSAINAAIVAAGNNKIYFPSGVYAINGTILFESKYHQLVDFGGSSFLWQGSSSSSAFIIRDCLSCTFLSCRVVSSATYPMVSGFQIENGSGSAVNPSKSVFNSIVIEGSALNGLTYGFYISKNGGGGDAGNDFHHFNDCSVYNYTDSGLYMDGTQQYGIFVSNAGFVSATGAAASKSVTHNASGGSLFVYGGGGGNNTFTDFYFTAPGRPCTIDGFSSEQSASFLRTSGSGAQFFQITLLNCNWESNSLSLIYPDKKVIYFTYQGQIIVDGCLFVSNDPSADFVLQTTGGSAGYIQKSGQIRATAIKSAAVNPLVGIWDIDNTTVIDRSNLSLNPILLNTAVYGTGQFNGVNSALITLYGAKTLVFESGSVTITGLQEVPGISGYLGQQVTMIFNTAVTVTNGTYLKLAGAVDFVAAANDTLTLVYNGSGTSPGVWTEVARSVN